MSLELLLDRQKSWAGPRLRGQGHILDTIEANLFQSLSSATQMELAGGAGDELGLGRRKAKLRSLRSSAAFACNIFDPWRGLNLHGLTTALGLNERFEELAFEYKVPHGLPTKPPHLDILLFGRGVCPVGIEVKFAEPYDPPNAAAPLYPKYFPSGRQRWADLGLTQSQAAAEAIGRTAVFLRLNAAQLLKHILGLGYTFGTLRPVRLRYLWYDLNSEAARQHQQEVDHLAAMLKPEIDFEPIRFQELLAGLEAVDEPRAQYLHYLRSRYLAA